MTVPLKEYVDKAGEAVEARVYARLDKAATTTQVWAAVFTGVATILGVFLSVLAFAGDRFDAGLSMSSFIAEQRKRDDAQDQKLEQLDNKVDEILRRLPPPQQGQRK